ncbi:hypothetical protein COCOR_05207 [Corallococcus coralloides DSM 2259]|uniref:Lipoprotein n=1 Tax=Corallococcus coralloides (strain ATCC 25202 / DSM 2259 / NBRC 100086 / M2) TaxID=1144275 RepID=H8MSW0_CORCM|nr:hypothetical protein [Corallococcus coralloides]AFE06250.1 hypothetical protein COCOR_05207 [Corallococcus coralloides DSM 2259]
MRRKWMMALATAGCLLAACGPADAPPAEDPPFEAQDPAGEEPGTTEHELTPCLSQCYATCVGNTPEVVACRQDCRDACAGG